MYDLIRRRYSSWSILVRAYPTILTSLGRNWFRYLEIVSSVKALDRHDFSLTRPNSAGYYHGAKTDMLVSSTTEYEGL